MTCGPELAEWGMDVSLWKSSDGKTTIHFDRVATTRISTLLSTSPSINDTVIFQVNSMTLEGNDAKDAYAAYQKYLDQLLCELSAP